MKKASFVTIERKGRVYHEPVAPAEKAKSPIRAQGLHKRKYSAASTLNGSAMDARRPSAIAQNRDTHQQLYNKMLSSYERYDRGESNAQQFQEDLKNQGIRPTTQLAEVLRTKPGGAGLQQVQKSLGMNHQGNQETYWNKRESADYGAKNHSRPAGTSQKFNRTNLIASQSTGYLGNQDLGGTQHQRGAFARHKKSVALPKKDTFKSDKKENLRKTLLQYQDGAINVTQFKSDLSNNGVKVDGQLNVLIRQVEAGNTEGAFTNFGKEIFKQVEKQEGPLSPQKRFTKRSQSISNNRTFDPEQVNKITNDNSWKVAAKKEECEQQAYFTKQRLTNSKNHGQWMKHLNQADTGSANFKDLAMIKEEERNISGKYNERRGRSALANRIDQQRSSIQEYIKPTDDTIKRDEQDYMASIKSKGKNNLLFQSSSKAHGPGGFMSNPYKDGSSGGQDAGDYALALTAQTKQSSANSAQKQKRSDSSYLSNYAKQMDNLKKQGADPRQQTTGENSLQAATANIFSKQPATKPIRSNRTNEGSYTKYATKEDNIRRSSRKNMTSNENPMSGPFKTLKDGDYSYIKAYGQYTKQF